MYTFKLNDYQIELRKHSNGTLAIMTHPNISDKIKLGVISSGEVYKLVEFQWDPILNSIEGEREYKGPKGLLDYIFDNYLGDISLDVESRESLTNLIGKMLDGITIDLETGSTYTLSDGNIAQIK